MDKNYRYEPLVSIIVPLYNGESYIEDCLSSVLNQTYSRLEVIIADDSSEDRSVQIAREFAQADSRVIVHVYDETIGLAGNWNRGLEKATGTYVKIVCQDDLLYPEYVESAVKVFEEYKNVSLICSFEKPIGANRAERREESFPGSRLIEKEAAQQSVLNTGNWIGSPTAVMFRMNTLNKSGYFDVALQCSLDMEMWLRLLRFGDLYVVPEILYSCRTHSGQETNRCLKSLGFLKDKISIIQKLIDKPELYATGLSDDYLRSLQRKDMLRLLNAARKSRKIKFSDMVRFISKRKPVFQTMVLILKSFILGLYIPFFQSARREFHR